jgi:transcriptional regulator with XRE-family HTH domain
MRSTETLGGYIRAQGEVLGLSQAAIARQALATAPMISRIDAGQRRGRAPILGQLAEALHMPATELLARAGYVREAEHWRTREATSEASDPLLRFEYALELLRLPPSLKRAVQTLVRELVCDREAEFQHCFDAAVARYPAPAAGDAARFDTLRGWLFAVQDEAPE